MSEEIEIGHGQNKVVASGGLSIIVFVALISVLCNVSVVGMFLKFIQDQTSHTDFVDDVRIETCHATSNRSAQALEALSEVMLIQATEFGIFGNKLNSIHDSVKANEMTFKQLLELERREASRKEY